MDTQHYTFHKYLHDRRIKCILSQRYILWKPIHKQCYILIYKTMDAQRYTFHKYLYDRRIKCILSQRYILWKPIHKQRYILLYEPTDTQRYILYHYPHDRRIKHTLSQHYILLPRYLSDRRRTQPIHRKRYVFRRCHHHGTVKTSQTVSNILYYQQ
ncbi:hypothetical protein N7492_006382 [Penicillium capsulatum]|uniref:Uncharacterized protein n=1 Tax=Penicillium capsulatum TaxID=69766 RepID=A0A9W9I2S1_9EURO|nr:hypothetical protein N7492_006382 [Penicillium capsulatum]